MDSIETKVAVLERDLEQVKAVLPRLDLAIDKIGDVSAYIKEILAVHESKLNSQDNINSDIYESLEIHRRETAESNKELHSRITTMKREYDDKLDATEEKLLAAIESLKKIIEKEEESNSKRIASLEKTKYTMIGIGTVIGFILSTVIPTLAKILM